MTKKAAEKEIAVKEGINAPIALNVTDAVLNKLKKKFEKIPDLTKKEGYEFVRVGLGELRTLRTDTGKSKTILKKEAIAYNKRVDTEFNRVIEIISSIEGPMKAAKDAEDAKKEAARDEKRKAEETRKFKINQKINEIREIAFSFTDETSEAIREQIDAVKEIQITKDTYEEFVTAAQMAVIDVKTRLEALLENVVKREEADAERKLEDERLAGERKKLDEEKAAADKETERLKAIGQNLDHIKDLPFGYAEKDSSAISLGIASLEAMAITEEEFGEFTPEAEAAKKNVLDKMQILKKQMDEKGALLKKQKEIDIREKKADEEREAAAEEERLATEAKDKEKKEKAAEQANEALQLERYNESLASIELLVGNKKVSKSVLDAIIDGNIPNIIFG